VTTPAGPVLDRADSIFSFLPGKKCGQTIGVLKTRAQTKRAYETTTSTKRWHCDRRSTLRVPSQQCKIEPPPTVIGTNKEMSAKAAANALTSAISGGKVSANYQNTVNNTYVTVGQDDVAFYLLMQAYNCESSRGHTAQAAEILRLARQELARRHRAQPPSTAVAVTSTTLTATENKVLKNSPLKNDIQKTIAAPKAAPSPVPKPAKQHKKKAKPSPSPTP